MSFSTNFTFDTSAVISQLNGVERRLEPEGKRLVSRLSTIGLAEAKRNVPVDTGILRGSILLKPINISGTQITAGYGTNVHYAEFVEFGHTLWGKGFKQGAFYMKKSEEAINASIQAEVARYLQKLLAR